MRFDRFDVILLKTVGILNILFGVVGIGILSIALGVYFLTQTDSSQSSPVLTVLGSSLIVLSLLTALAISGLNLFRLRPAAVGFTLLVLTLELLFAEISLELLAGGSWDTNPFTPGIRAVFTAKAALYPQLRSFYPFVGLIALAIQLIRSLTPVRQGLAGAD